MPTIGEIRMFTGSRVPSGWLACDGSRYSTQDDALYSVIGNTYGGDSNSYAVPDLRGRLPMGANVDGGGGRPPYAMGQNIGQAAVQLTTKELPAHSHDLCATPGAPTTATPGPAVMVAEPAAAIMPYNNVSLANGPVGSFAANAIAENPSQQLPIDNLMPSCGIMFIIARQGVFPAQSD